MLNQGEKARPDDMLTPEQEIKGPFVPESLGLKDEYSESELEEALIHNLEGFLLELGNDFPFVGRQRRLRIDDERSRIDLVFLHRGLRCLVLIDLKLARLTAGDVGRMNLYPSYARKHRTRPAEDAPVGLLLWAERGHGAARYALAGMADTTLAAQYWTALPSEKSLADELERPRELLKAGRIEVRADLAAGPSPRALKPYPSFCLGFGIRASPFGPVPSGLRFAPVPCGGCSPPTTD
jgi:hypothetical protein